MRKRTQEPRAPAGTYTAVPIERDDEQLDLAISASARDETIPHRDPKQVQHELRLKWSRGLDDVHDAHGRL